MVVLGYKTGQLGNRLFVYTHFIANSIKNEYRVFNPSFDEYGGLFKNIKDLSIDGFPHGNVCFLGIWFRKVILFCCRVIFKMMAIMKKDCIGNSFVRFFSLAPEKAMDLSSAEFGELRSSTKCLVVQGWLFRDEKNVQEHKEKIKKHFKICEEHSINIDRLMKNAYRLGNIVIGLHIRRGDYKNFLGGKYYYSIEEYRKVMGKIQQIFPNDKICWIICSNEKINIQDFSGFICIEGNGQIVEDMYTFSHCDYIVGVPSTYTGWASFYGEKPLYQINAVEEDIMFNVVGE